MLLACERGGAMNLINRLPTKVLLVGLAVVVVALGSTGIGALPQTRQVDGSHATKQSPASSVPEIEVRLDEAAKIDLPVPKKPLAATAFKMSNGKAGWVIQIPGGHPIATPAYADGTIFVGGGYGSHEFYAFNAETGALVWQIKTSDDGPTAAVVEDGYVAFDTESCTLIISDARTGKVIWQEWLGDPLMSQPAIAKGRVYIAHPAGQKRQGKPTANASQVKVGGHRLLSADLKTGRHLWEQEIPADVISAPVVVGDRIYFTCFDGTSFVLDAANGSVIWKKKGEGTSAPVVAGDQIVVTRKEKVADKTLEGLARLGAQDGSQRDAQLLARGEADYLLEGSGGGLGSAVPNLKALDSLVGFAFPPPAAKLGVAGKTVGIDTVVGGWAYQGSRPALGQDKILNAQGSYLNALDAKTGQARWRAKAVGGKLSANERLFSPPALGRQYMYLGSTKGFLAAVRQQDGELGFLYALTHPIVFQPALARGRVYLGTGDGLLVSLETGDADADGWYAWGGNAQHNK
jgi:Ca-activated chloride channel family protein